MAVRTNVFVLLSYYDDVIAISGSKLGAMEIYKNKPSVIGKILLLEALELQPGELLGKLEPTIGCNVKI